MGDIGHTSGNGRLRINYSVSGTTLTWNLQGYWTTLLSTLVYLCGHNDNSNSGYVALYLNKIQIWRLNGYQSNYKSRCAYFGDNSPPSTWYNFSGGSSWMEGYPQNVVSGSATLNYGSNTLRFESSGGMRLVAKSTSNTITLSDIDTSVTIDVPYPSYTVSYNANGHGTAPATQTKTHGTDLTLRPFISNVTTGGGTNTVTITGNANGTTWSGSNGSATYKAASTTYTQTYWNTASNGSGTNYGSQGTYSTNAGATMYAQWSSSSTAAAGQSYTLPTGTPTKPDGTTNVLTVTYNANGGTCSVNSATSSKPVLYTFKGWFTASSGGTQRTTSSRVTAAETVYAQMNETVGAQSAITLPTASQCSKSGYSLAGWATSSTATTAAYLPGASYTPSASIVLYAVWKILGVAYIDNGTNFEPYMIYIDNGTTWDQYTGYVDTGTEWKMLGLAQYQVLRTSDGKVFTTSDGKRFLVRIQY